MASGVPVVSTDVGGVPFIVQQRRHRAPGRRPATTPRWPPRCGACSASPILPSACRDAALAEVQQYTWPRVRQRWTDVYATQRPATGGAPAVGQASPQCTPASVYTRRAGVLFPLHERLKGHSTRRGAPRSRQSQWWPPERLAAAAVRRTARALLRNANDTCPTTATSSGRIGFDPRAMTVRRGSRAPAVSHQGRSSARTPESLKADDGDTDSRATTPAARAASRWSSSSARSASATTSPPSGAPRAGGAWTSATGRSWSGARRSSWARRTACASCATGCCAPGCCPRSKCPTAKLDGFVAAIRDDASAHAVRLSVGAGAHRPPCREPRHGAGRLGIRWRS